MSKAVKCVSCNIVIDEMLSYVQNKLSVIDEDTLVRICSSAFTSEEIEKSKELLFESVPVEKAKIKRKNKGKERRDLVDIVNVFKTVEPDLFPIFVAKNLERLPPILFDHLDCTKLLKDLLRMQTDLKEVTETYVTQAQLDEVKADILKMQNDSLIPASACKINTMKRGGWLLDSGPIGLSHVQNSSLDECINTVDVSSLSGPDNNIARFRNIREVDGEISFKNRTATTRQRARGASESPPPGVAAVASPSETDRLAADAVTSPRRSYSTATAVPAPPPILQQSKSDITNNTNCKNKQMTTERTSKIMTAYQPVSAGRDDAEGWQSVSYRRKHNMNYRYHGSAGSARDNAGKFKAAVKNVPIFITKVHKDTTEQDIADYVYQKTEEVITLERIVLKYPKPYNAFKFLVAESKLSLFLNSGLWPEGVIFRRFVNFKLRNSNSNGVNIGTVTGSL